MPTNPIPLPQRVRELDKELIEKLRMPVDQGGYDGFSTDPLHIQAADRIVQLLSALGTEQTMHAAWRKRAEECEREYMSSEDLHAGICELCGKDKTHRHKRNVPESLGAEGPIWVCSDCDDLECDLCAE